MGASAISVVLPAEERDVRAFVPDFRGILRWVPNPIDVDGLQGGNWIGVGNSKRLVYLGRFDVLHKGIDILTDIGRFLSSVDVELHLYGVEDVKTKAWLQQLKRDLPVNVHFHGPVFGAEKMKILTRSSLYIQMSRWEAFPISIAEAMYLGVPCAIAQNLHLADLFRQHDLGLVLPQEPAAAASRLSEALSESDRLHGWSHRAQAFARMHFQPRKVACEYLDLYGQVLSL